MAHQNLVSTTPQGRPQPSVGEDRSQPSEAGASDDARQDLRVLVEQQQKEINRLQGEMKRLERRDKEKQTKIASLQGEISRRGNHYQREIDKLQGEIDELKSIFQEKKGEMEAAAAKLDQVQQLQRDALQSFADDIKGAVDSLLRRLEEAPMV